MKYYVYIENDMVAEVEGIQFATKAYREVCELVPNSIVSLVDGNTGEVIESSDDLEGYEPDYDECGFDPYEGCYTYDC